MARHTCGFGLNCLGTTYLQPFGCGVGVERHILCLEWCRTVTVLTEYAAEGGGNNAFTHVATCPGKHNRMKFLHI